MPFRSSSTLNTPLIAFPVTLEPSSSAFLRLFQLNFVFNSIAILQNRSDLLLLLLEEDFYLSPDALVFLKKMEAEKPR